MSRKCKNCGSELNKEWNYCPFCGNKIEPRWKNILEFGMEDVMEKMMKMANDMLRDFMGMDAERERMPAPPQKHVVKIRITPAGVKVEQGGNVHNSPEMANVLTDRKDGKKERKFKSVKEPKIKSIKKEGSVIEVEMEVEGVKSPEDIEIIQLDESAEFRAYAKDTMYFKILDIPSSYRLVENRVKDGGVYLKFSLV